MPLTDVWKANKDSVLQMTVEQIVTIAGDGRLTDDSECAGEFRTYLSETSTDALALYATYCLENKFDRSGLVLQDVVNELGRRLEYTVENGRYQGVKGEIGFDGIWEDERNYALIIEVKTTDAFRLSLDTVTNYRNELIKKERISESSSVLIVVGRTDTGDLESQVRGSKHSWHVQIVGIDSLIQLVRIKESADSQLTITKIRTLLIPIEYTRIDGLVDIVFAATKDVADVQEDAQFTNAPDENNKSSIESVFDRTPAEIIAQMRDKIVSTTSHNFDKVFIKKTRATYWSPDRTSRFVCTISKRYQDKGILKYWYAYHPSWDEFLGGGVSSFLILGCVDLEIAFLLPLSTVRELLPNFNVTERQDKMYWHIKIAEPEQDSYFLQVPSPGEDMALLEYQVAL